MAWLGRLVRRSEDVRLARVVLAFHAGDDPVARANDVAAFERVDPAVDMHRLAAVLARLLAENVRPTEAAHHFSFPVVRLRVLCWERADDLAGEPLPVVHIIERVVAVLEPLRGFNHHRLLAELRHDYSLFS